MVYPYYSVPLLETGLVEKFNEMQKRRLTEHRSVYEKASLENWIFSPRGLQDLKCDSAARVRDTGQQCWWTEAKTGRSLARSVSKRYRFCCRRVEETSVSVCLHKEAAFWTVVVDNWTNWEEKIDLVMDILSFDVYVDKPATRFYVCQSTAKALVTWGWSAKWNCYLIRNLLGYNAGQNYEEITLS